MTVKRMEGIIAKAKWTVVAHAGDSNNPVSIDTAFLVRVKDMVLFSTKWEKRGTINYYLNVGHCNADRFAQTNGFVVYSGSPKLIPTEVADEVFTVEPKSVGYAILDYVCKKAKVITSSK